MSDLLIILSCVSYFKCLSVFSGEAVALSGFFRMPY